LLLLGREWLIAWSVKKRFTIKAKVNERLLALMKPTGRGEEEEDGRCLLTALDKKLTSAATQAPPWMDWIC
jgi:hypothetical protein